MKSQSQPHEWTDDVLLRLGKGGPPTTQLRRNKEQDEHSRQERAQAGRLGAGCVGLMAQVVGSAEHVS